jgi:antitoxin component YwqK of YwqJK toxin-antitoxin module
MKLRLPLVPLCILFFLAACESSTARRPRAVPLGYTGDFSTWWNDENIKEVGTYLEGLRQGDVQTFYADGTLQLSGEFVGGQPEGVVHMFHPNGVEASSETFVEGQLQGQRQLFDGAGALVGQSDFVGGKQHGVERLWSASGQQVLEGSWHQGLPVGHWRHWQFGRIQREEHYWMSHGVPAGYLETVFGGGGSVSNQTLMTKHDEVWSGWVTTWHHSGRQASLVDIREGMRHGRDMSWDSTGRLTAEGHRVDDKRTGTWTFFGGRGEAARRVVYADGEELLPSGTTPGTAASDPQ